MLQATKRNFSAITAHAVDMFFDPCTTARLAKDVEDRVRSQQVRAVVRLTPAMMVANIVNASALVIVLEISDQSTLLSSVWAMAAIAIAVQTLWAYARRRSVLIPATLGKEVVHRVVGSAALFGFIWTVPGLFFLPSVTGSAQAFLGALVTGMIGGGAIALYPIPAAAIVCSGLITAGGLLGLALTGDPVLIGFALIAAAFFFVVSKSILRHSEIFVSEFVGRLEIEGKNQVIERFLEETRASSLYEKKESERRLAHAQKMEAIGQLTGGIAHDFNNLLAIIQGNAELIAVEGKADDTLVKPIMKATATGSDLIQRLLLIARKKALRPQTVDIGQLIGGMVSLLRRTLGAHLCIETLIDSNLWHAMADQCQLEGAILNLSLNARDAMPETGKLVIEAKNASPQTSATLRKLGVGSGEYVQITVRDTGRGMTARVKERALEPFFTTKKFGQGSGLGLSTVFGFTSQSNGHLSLESAVGVGTTVKLFLPRSHSTVRVPSSEITDRRLHHGHGETIVVVEDDTDVPEHRSSAQSGPRLDVAPYTAAH